MEIKLDAIGITSKNLTKTIQFYELLGLKFPALKEEDSHVEAVTQSGFRLMLDSEELMKKLKPNWKSPVGQRMTLAFKLKTPAEVDGLCKIIEEKGFKLETKPWDAFWGQRYATAIDPDGNQVDLFADQ